jgi:DNA-binding transcriptional regulator GbsR (MarR family)
MIDRNKESFIEESAILFESLGFTRMAGRIIGYLLMMEEEIISFNELTAALKASKSSISTNLHMLMNANFITMKTISGDRKTYYSLNHDVDWTDIMAKELKSLNILRVLFNKAYTLRENKKDQTSLWTQSAINFYEWISNELNNILKKFKEIHSKD